MKKTLLLLLLFSGLKISSQTYVFIPDANFRSYLQSNMPTAMNGNSLNISSTTVTTVWKNMYVAGLSISDLTGVQYFSSLEYLDCQYNSLTSLPPLPNSLQTLKSSNNALTSLPTLPNSLLTLECNSNSLTALPSLPNSLQGLYCWYNTINTLPALPNSLQSLGCAFNSLTNLPTLPNSLQGLYCHNNNIICFPVFPQSINTVSLTNNPYNCLPNYVLPAMNNYTTTPLCVAGNSNGCTFVGIKELSADNIQIITYPNPTTGNFTVETSIADKQIAKLYDLNGRLVFSINFSGKTNIDATSLNDGIYNLVIKTGDNIANKKLVIVR
jgi:Leucine-rich repeat (LRR) protein